MSSKKQHIYRILLASKSAVGACSVSLTLEQIKWLRSKSNASKLLREIIDKAMKLESGEYVTELEEQLADLTEQWHVAGDLSQLEGGVWHAKVRELWNQIEELRKKLEQAKAEAEAASGATVDAKEDYG